MGLKVFDLSCEHDHVFEGWFSSQDAFEGQLARGLVRCPLCDSAQITRRVSAPHLNVSHLRAEPSARQEAAPAQRASVASPSANQLTQLQAEVLRQIRRIVHRADDVGAQFADEARRIHSGEAEERAIRGVASPEECRELVDEGIAIMPIPGILDDERLQ